MGRSGWDAFSAAPDPALCHAQNPPPPTQPLLLLFSTPKNSTCGSTPLCVSPAVTSRRSGCACPAIRSALPTACWGCRSSSAPPVSPSDSTWANEDPRHPPHPPLYLLLLIFVKVVAVIIIIINIIPPQGISHRVAIAVPRTKQLETPPENDNFKWGRLFWGGISPLFSAFQGKKKPQRAEFWPPDFSISAFSPSCFPLPPLVWFFSALLLTSSVTS